MEAKKEELLRFIRWISEEPAFWYFVICDGGISTEDAIKLIESLIKNEFYILVPIVIGHTRSLEMENLLNKLCLSKLCESWNGYTMAEIVEEVSGLLETVKKKA